MATDEGHGSTVPAETANEKRDLYLVNPLAAMVGTATDEVFCEVDRRSLSTQNTPGDPERSPAVGESLLSPLLPQRVHMDDHYRRPRMS